MSEYVIEARPRRKMKRWKKIMLWSLSILLVLGIGGLFAANYVINRFLESMVADIAVVETAGAQDETTTPGDGAEVGAGEDGGGVDAADGDADAAGQEGDSGAEGAGDADGTTGGANGPSSGTGGDTPSTDGAADAQPPQEDLDGYAAEISTDKAEHVQNSVTVGDKTKVASIVLSQLSLEDMKRLQELASGGLTIEEKKEARALFLEKLTPEQYDEIIAVAEKHGLSTGKTYEEQASKE
ncbi:hypothetical protein IDH44_20420 [Paenibacillus sp. IB182496]|uniref:Uncharacterized protein n=1 Tax=Paenibacillus sabuli TaxID=2772509 RepID=A0A927GUC6_9BACL|nr:hypothetical protein [Paenibacillus sabuli]MBD2847562.1 hypothetical protein [Paenibacillus sabuli]